MGSLRIFLSDWKYIDKSTQTVEAKVWYYFVAARLVPVNVNSEVLKRCAFLTYAIMTNKDVGYVINQEFYTMIAKTKWNDSVGFFIVITTLCLKAGI